MATPANADDTPTLTLVSPPRPAAAVARDSRPPSGIAALTATEKGTGGVLDVAVTERGLRRDSGPASDDRATTSPTRVSLVGAAAGVFAEASADQPDDANPARAAEPTGATPGSPPAEAEAVEDWLDAMPFAGALPLGVDALGQAASALLGRLGATTAEATDEPFARDLAWLAGAAAALGGAGYAARGAAKRRRAGPTPGPRSHLAAWGGRHARD